MKTKRKSRKYSLYQKVEGRWRRVSAYAARKSEAVRVFQNRLLEGACSGLKLELRLIKVGVEEEIHEIQRGEGVSG